MDVGLVFPQLEIGTDPELIRGYATTAEGQGLDHVLAYDHVLGVVPRADWEGSYDYRDPFHEPLTLFSHLAPVTEDLEFVTGVLVLPQRETPLVAKQAAQVDLLSDGRFRLGAGVGWNEPEFEAMGADFSTRGRRIEEQVDLLRELWTERAVTFDGEFHDLDGAGINPLPVQQPIPLWLGGAADPVLDRIARKGDGWLPPSGSPSDHEERFERLWEFCEKRDRDPDDVGIHARVKVDPEGEPGQWIDAVSAWEEFGADYLAVDAMGRGLDPAGHLAFAADLAETLSTAGLID
ncbi:LLM class F420-dependent oxidoreductase [Halobacteriales archaeon QS_8_69_26]|nr:MAG: LLM class F420-dependent oxidoreductase [Halobacteriales archaeon QS_8_69_26]